MTKKLFLRLLFTALFAFFVLGVYSFSLFSDGNSKVLNPKPVPPFEIPKKVAGRNYVYFIAIGDQGTGAGGQRQVAELMNQKAQQDSLQFVLLLGDNFYSSGVASVSDPQWQTKFVEIYNLPFLNVPFYAALGNHDHRKNRARFQVEYARQNPKWIMPAPYYAFTRDIDGQQTMEFFALDTERIVEEKEYDPEQIAWLERALRASRARWKIVFGHHPVFSYGEHGHETRMIEIVRPLLEKYEVDLYLCGHDHDRQLLQPIGGVHYLVSGTGAKSRDTAYGPATLFAATNLGFAWFRVSAQDFHLQFLDGGGKIEYAHTWAKGAVPKRQYALAEVMDNSVEFKKDKKKSRKRERWWWFGEE